MNLAPTLSMIRQWTFPSAFRISVPAISGMNGTVLMPVNAAVESNKHATHNGSSVLPSQTETCSRDDVEIRSVNAFAPSDVTAACPVSVHPQLALGLCNDLFRLRRNAEALQAAGKDCKELRSIQRALENVDFLFRDHGIECLDLSNQVYDDGRNDFEPITIEEIAGLAHKRISLCERPAVRLNNQLIQKARGIVAVPSSRAPS